MRLRPRIFVCFCAVLFLLLPAKAQNRVQRARVLQGMYDENFMLSLVPVPLAFNGFRVDFDCRLRDRLWLQLGPQYDCKRKGAEIKTDGFCLEANLRYYVKNSSSRGFYVASGLGVDYNRIQDLEKVDGEEVPYKLTSTRFGGQVQIGYSFGLWPRALMDLYVGAAFRHAFNGFSDERSRQIVENGNLKPWQYHFSGLFMQVGVRIGMQFGR